MKKLDNISKKEIFTVPDGYFDKLPSKIQSRITDTNQTAYAFTFVSVLKYALPAILIIVLAGIWFYPSTQDDVQVNAASMLSTVNTEDLVAYLDDSDLSTDDVLESVEFSKVDLDEIEGSIYELNTDDESFKNFIEEID